MRMRALVVIGALMCLMGCGPRGDQSAPTTAPTRSSSTADPSEHQGSLTAQERSLATAMAKPCATHDFEVMDDLTRMTQPGLQLL